VDAIAVLVVVLVSLIVLGIAANVWGADSRPGLGDDHKR
jgi:nitrogen fixation-related uncharacterized protein